MIKQIQKKFIRLAMISIISVLLLLMAVINFANYLSKDAESSRILTFLVENNGSFPKMDFQEPVTEPDDLPDNEIRNLHKTFTAETPYETRFFTVTLTLDGKIVTVNTGQIAAIDSSEAIEIAQSLYSSGKNSGYYSDYKYAATLTNDTILYVFIDCSNNISSVRTFLLHSLAVSFVGIIAIYLLLRIFSKRILRPIEESYQKQKEFITNAGHDLKTPLAVITSSLDVLELEETENKWIHNIREQTKKLTVLTQNLIQLARMEEAQSKAEFQKISLTDCMKESLFSFIPPAEQKGLLFQTTLANDCYIQGDVNSMHQLFDILADNALKYCKENGTISFSLQKNGKHFLIIAENPAEHLQAGNMDAVFDRFYREDSSRNQTVSGFGIGLAMARSIVYAHNGKIHAESPDGNIFRITIQF